MKRIMDRARRVFELSSLGASVFDSWKIILAALFISILWKLSPRDVSIPVSIKYAGAKFDIFLTGYSDLVVLHEIFVEKAYALKTAGEIKVVVDAGANVGFSALYFSALYPEARVICFEPDPRTFQKLQKNIAGHPRVSAHNMGLGEKDGEMAFYSSLEASVSYSFVHRDEKHKEVSVPVKSLGSFMREENLPGIDILKFDVEGFEAELLRGCAGENISYFLGEVHFDLINEDREWFEKYFSGYSLAMKNMAPSRSMLEASRAV